MAMPAGQAAPSPQPAPIDRKVPRGIPGERFFPWFRPASTATIFRHFPIAMAQIAGPLPVLAKPAYANRAVTTAGVTNSFPTTMPQVKCAGCDPFHRRRGRVALKLQNARKTIPIIVRPAGRHPYRLRPDRHRDRRGSDRADLSPSDLIRRGHGGPGTACHEYADVAKGSVRERSSPSFLLRA